MTVKVEHKKKEQFKFQKTAYKKSTNRAKSPSRILQKKLRLSIGYS